ncbi:hypothetical protein [Solitalea koreensis]|uniref:Holin-X, holin superfamily III n=1 Tax=Solitalea koreensis TaxID=543615 RepID=A0A521BY01_9SPHI|nr:hypothetical protein [Solitalea koreensis]SMO52057.1 Putative Holin-X, holin superfamily III [Solitalea koreensis]
MIDDRKKLTDMVNDVKEYMNIKFNIVKLTMVENIATLLANLITQGSVVLFLLLFFLFGSIALGFYLSTLVHSFALGFLMVAGIYLLFAIIIMVSKEEYIEKPLVNKFIQNFLKEADDDKFKQN